MRTPAIIITRESITVVFDGSNPIIIRKDQTCFEKCRAAIKSQDWDGLKKLIDLEEQVNNYVYGPVKVIEGTLFYKDEPVHNLIVTRILQFMREGLPFEPMIKFLINMMANPSFRSRQELYNFLEHKKLPITEDGYFLAYKAVRSDFQDIYSGTMHNGIGTTVKMERRNVDDDCTQGCSYGLHAGSLDYVQGYGSQASSKFLIVKINPKDVVSVPSEDSRKLRTCEYIVLSEFKLALEKPCYAANGDEWDGEEEDDDVDDFDNNEDYI